MSREVLFLLILLSIATLLRITSIFYGLPLHLSIDEPSLVSGIISLKENLNPGRFDWPHLYFYINFLFYGIGFILNTLNLVPSFWGDISIYFVISRLLSVLFGVLTILAIYIATKKIFANTKIAMLAATFVTFLPMHVLESRLAKLDIALTFFVTIAVYFIYKVYKDPSYRNFIIAGIIIGLAVSIKYNAFLIYLSLFLAFANSGGFLQKLKDYKTYLKFISAGIASLFAFLLGTPFALLDFGNFWSYKPRVGILWQFQNVGNVPWPEYSTHVYTTFFEMYRNDLGLGVWLLFMIFILMYLFFNYRKSLYNFTLFPAIIISLYISKLDRSPSHYFLFLLPLYIIPLADFTYDILKRFTNLQFKHKVTLLIFLLIPSIYMSVLQAIVYTRVDTRLLAYNWFTANIKQNEYHVYVVGDEIGTVVFQEKRSDKVKRIDPDIFDKPLPALLIVAYPNMSSEYLKSVNWNPREFGGSSERVLPQSELLYEVNADYRMGPSVLVFKVNELLEPTVKNNETN